MGLPLAKQLIQGGHNIVATKRSEENAAELSQFGITGLSYELGDNLAKPYYGPLFNSDLLILNVPPGRKTFSPDIFIAQMMDLTQQAKERGIERILFISTSAVYGENNRIVYEYSEPDAQTHSAKAHVKIEHFCQQLFSYSACILRLSGLVGSDRHPIHTLAGRKQLTNGQRLVNLIHQEDVIQAIQRVVDNQVFGHTLHLSCSEHPNRKDYYQWAAKKLELPAPEFLPLHDALATGKQINADFTLDKLEMQLRYPDPKDMLAKQQIV